MVHAIFVASRRCPGPQSAYACDNSSWGTVRMWEQLGLCTHHNAIKDNSSSTEASSGVIVTLDHVLSVV